MVRRQKEPHRSGCVSKPISAPSSLPNVRTNSAPTINQRERHLRHDERLRSIGRQALLPRAFFRLSCRLPRDT
jgi:hypothetical protein